jgi:hypothetical protein
MYLEKTFFIRHPPPAIPLFVGLFVGGKKLLGIVGRYPFIDFFLQPIIDYYYDNNDPREDYEEMEVSEVLKEMEKYSRIVVR